MTNGGHPVKKTAAQPGKAAKAPKTPKRKRTKPRQRLAVLRGDSA